MEALISEFGYIPAKGWETGVYTVGVSIHRITMISQMQGRPKSLVD
jgi:hypothetical protein